MIYLSGHSGTHVKILAAEGLPIGFIAQPHSWKGARQPPYRLWATDNGMFASGVTPEEWWSWLERMARWPNCLFATAPDVVGDAEGTLALSHWLPSIRSLGLPAAFVGQDGLLSGQVPWDDLDCFFVGGTTAWKVSEAAWALVEEANHRGKWTHIGRVNTARRFRAALVQRCDSVDGTLLRFGPTANAPRLRRWLSQGQAQLLL